MDCYWGFLIGKESYEYAPVFVQPRVDLVRLSPMEFLYPVCHELARHKRTANLWFAGSQSKMARLSQQVETETSKARPRASDARPPQRQAQAIGTLANADRRKSVFIVDDHPVFSDGLSRLLRTELKVPEKDPPASVLPVRDRQPD